MKRIFTLLTLLCCSCSTPVETKAENDWVTQILDHDSGCFVQSIIDYYDSDAGEWRRIIKNKQGGDNYQVYEGDIAEATAELDADNWSRVESYASIAIDDVDDDYHLVSVSVGREHASKTMLPLCDTTGVTYFDAWAVSQLEAQHDGIAWCRMTFHKPLPDPFDVVGPEPIICDGMAIRGHCHSSHVEYEWNAGLWQWERSGEIVRYSAEDGGNVTYQLPPQTFAGLRGLKQQQFFFPFLVSDGEWVESYVDVNGSGWEPFFQILSEQQGTFTLSRDYWSASVEVKKEIEAIE